MKHILFYTVMILLPVLGLVSKNNAQVKGNEPYEGSCFRITEERINLPPIGFQDTPKIGLVGSGSANWNGVLSDTSRIKMRYFLVGYVGDPVDQQGIVNGIMDAECNYFPPYDSLVSAVERRNNFKIKNVHIISISEVTKEENDAFWGRKKSKQ